MKDKKREAYIKAVVDAWNDKPASAKPDLLVNYPDLYFACAWLASHETVTAEMKRRRWW